MATAFERFDFTAIPVGTEEDPDTEGQYSHAVLEGWYALSIVEPKSVPDAWTAAGVAEAVEKANADQTPFDEADMGHISPFVDPWGAVYALRRAIRVLVNETPESEDRNEAIRAVGWALKSVESPD